MRSGEASVLLVGPANAGKSTLFNALTGGRAATSNLSGTTVSVERGTLTWDGGRAQVIDLPGVASLTAGSPDELVTVEALRDWMDRGVSGGVLLVLDGPRLARSLYLALQVLEFEVPAVVAVNLMDEAREAGMEPDLRALEEALGVPVVGVVARTGEGLDDLRRRIAEMTTSSDPERGRDRVDWPEQVRSRVAELAPAVRGGGDGRRDAWVRWVLVSQETGGQDLSQLVERAASLPDRGELAAGIIAARYAWIDAREETFVPNRSPDDEDRPSRRTDALDRVLLHPVWGTLAFLGIMWAMFWGLFAGAEPVMEWMEDGIAAVGDGVGEGLDSLSESLPMGQGVAALFRDLLVDGVIAGVGAVVVFIPQIALLFLWLSVLQDLGYLSRAAALMDRILRAAGLPGKAFVPLLSGFACAVPAILSTRTMPRFRDRLLTMMVIPLTTCSARLPVYALLVGALFPAEWEGWPLPVRPSVMLAMYLLGVGVTLLAAVVLSRTVVPGQASETVLELPPYRWPSVRSVMRNVVQRTGEFLREAGRVILGATVVLWALLSFPRYTPEEVLPPDVLAQAESEGADLEVLASPYRLERSFAGRAGKFIEPLTEPVGFDWKVDVALIGAFAAREVFVGTLGVVYGIEEADEDSATLREAIRRDRRADGSRVFTPRVGLSIMVFFAFAMQCLSTLAVLRKETGGWRWPLFITLYMGVLAYGSSFVVYQGLGWWGWD